MATFDAQPQANLFVPFLGQSNGQHMSFIYAPYQPGSTSNTTSGAIVLEQKLTESTNYNVVTNTGLETNFAVGGSQVNGNGYFRQDDSTVWWYPKEYRPGGALIRAEQGLRQWLVDNNVQTTDEIAIVWSQGESDVGNVDPSDPETAADYKQSTLAVFDYLKSAFGYYPNLTFYLMPTGRLQLEAAANSGLSPEEITYMNDSVTQIHALQAEIAIERDDVHLTPDYSDLNTVYEEGLLYGDSYDVSYDEWSQDFWHLGHDGLKVNGSRLAEYIALDQGQGNVISFTDSAGNPAESVSISRDGLLDIDIVGNPGSETIEGTDNPDVIVGTYGVDEISGKYGNDVIIAGQQLDVLAGGTGNDVFFFDPSIYADVAAHSDRIVDFSPGSDRLDLSEFLKLSGYTGNDPIADGYVVVNSLSPNSLEIKFDADGAGAQSANMIAILENVDSTAFQNDLNSQFIFVPIDF
jgi:Ca2+-binding RTX toxin-like protein